MGSQGGGALGGAAGGAAAGFSVGGPWGAAIGGALGLVQGLLGGNQQKAQARIAAAQQKAQYIVSTAQAQAQTLISQNNAAAQNLVAGANNILAGANEDINLYIQSLNNARASKGNAEAYNALQETIGRYSDDYARGTFQQRLQMAELAGRASAELSGAGVGGTTAQLINRTMKLQEGMVEEEARIGNRTAMWDFAKQRGALAEGLADASSQLIRRDMTGYDPAAGTYFGTTTVGPSKNVGSYDTSNSWSSVLSSILGAGSQAYSTVKSMGNMYEGITNYKPK